MKKLNCVPVKAMKPLFKHHVSFASYLHVERALAKSTDAESFLEIFDSCQQGLLEELVSAMQLNIGWPARIVSIFKQRACRLWSCHPMAHSVHTGEKHARFARL